MSLYGRIRVTENPYSHIFCAEICHLPYLVKNYPSLHYAHERGLQILSHGVGWYVYIYAMTDCFYNLQSLIVQSELFAALVMNRSRSEIRQHDLLENNETQIEKNESAMADSFYFSLQNYVLEILIIQLRSASLV